MTRRAMAPTRSSARKSPSSEQYRQTLHNGTPKPSAQTRAASVSTLPRSASPGAKLPNRAGAACCLRSRATSPPSLPAAWISSVGPVRIRRFRARSGNRAGTYHLLDDVPGADDVVGCCMACSGPCLAVGPGQPKVGHSGASKTPIGPDFLPAVPRSWYRDHHRPDRMSKTARSGL